ncbi:MAG TPA: hypothetical protein VHK24_04285 [Steroidobacter sp.]|nr:hypothetical protein [Steroidobacter sp.]
MNGTDHHRPGMGHPLRGTALPPVRSPERMARVPSSEVIVVIGASGGIGRATASLLALGRWASRTA